MTPADKANFNNDMATFGAWHKQETDRLGENRDVTPYTTAAQTGGNGPITPNNPLGGGDGEFPAQVYGPAIPGRPEAPARPGVAPRPEIGAFTGPTRQTLEAPELRQRETLAAPTFGDRTSLSRTTLAMPTFAAREAGSVPARQTLEAPIFADRPVVERPEMAALNVGLDAFKASPDFQFQLDQGNRNIMANRAALGSLDSGAALKELQEYGQNLALGDYNQWRDYTTDEWWKSAGRLDQNYMFDASRSDRNYDADRSFDWLTYQYGQDRADRTYEHDLARYDRNYDSDRAFGWNQYQYGQDRADRSYEFDQNRLDRNYDSDRDFGFAQYRYGQDRSDRLYESDREYDWRAYTYGQDRADDLYSEDYDNAYEQWRYRNDMLQRSHEWDTSLEQRNFESDRAYGDSVYEDDRDYATGRFDAYTDDLMKIAAMGLTGLGYASGATQGIANAITGNGQVQGQSQIAQGNIGAGAAQDIAGFFQSALQNWKPGYGQVSPIDAFVPETITPYIPQQNAMFKALPGYLG